MASNRAFKNLASLRDGFNQPFVSEDESDADLPYTTVTPTLAPATLQSGQSADVKSMSDSGQASYVAQPGLVKVDGRRLRKVLKTPSVSLSVSVRREIHEEVSGMLFAGKSTWIALIDRLLTDYVENEKATSRFQKS